MYGQQLQNPIASAAKWMFCGFIIVIMMGISLGANIKDAKWLNSEIASAEANNIKIESAYKQATYELQVRLANAQTDADIQSIQREQKLLDAQYENDIRTMNQNLAHQDIAFKTYMTVFTIFGSAFAITLFISTTIWVSSRALVYIRSVPLREEPIKKFIPPVEKRIPNLAERESYDALDPKQILFANRLNDRLQEIMAKRDGQDDTELLVARMKAISNPAQMSKEEYNKRPLAN